MTGQNTLVGFELLLAIGSDGWYFDTQARILTCIALHTYASFCLFNIAHKTGNSYPYLAFVPIANVFVLAHAGGRSFLWAILVFIPFVQFLSLAIIGMGIAERRGRRQWTGALLGFPGPNLVALTYLGYCDPPFRVRRAPPRMANDTGTRPRESWPSHADLLLEVNECRKCRKLFSPAADTESARDFCSLECADLRMGE